MTTQLIDYQGIKDDILRLVQTVDSLESAMESVVVELARRLPHFNWVGIYLVEGDNLILGPFRGAPSPHTRIPLGQGICGAAAAAKATIVVPDVNADPRYLACSIKTKSELVVPIMDGAACLGEIDVDSFMPDAFTAADSGLLEDIAAELGQRLNSPK
jgi:GAF domain-containing protein